jgi:hypothetical protein
LPVCGIIPSPIESFPIPSQLGEGKDRVHDQYRAYKFFHTIVEFVISLKQYGMASVYRPMMQSILAGKPVASTLPRIFAVIFPDMA